MMPQGVTPFHYEEDNSNSKITGLAGLPVYMDLLAKIGLSEIIGRHLHLRTKKNSWSDADEIIALLLLNIAGGDCVDDIDILNADQGFCKLLKQLQLREQKLPRQQRRLLSREWEKTQQRLFPSQTAIRSFLKAFHCEPLIAERETSEVKSFIPRESKPLLALGKINAELMSFIQQNSPSAFATIDIDATLLPANKKEALYSYKGFKSYQPLNAWWDEQKVILNTEFRDGNVGAGYEILRFLKNTLRHLPDGVAKVSVRSDTAAFQYELMDFCEIVEKRDKEFKALEKIEFAIGCPVCKELKKAISQVEESEWQVLKTRIDKITGEEQVIMEGAEVCYVTNKGSKSMKSPEYRFVATRSLRSDQQVLLDISEEESSSQKKLPFPTATINHLKYKVHAIVSNCSRKELTVKQLVEWYHQRAGFSEQAHLIMKTDFAGGQLPSKYFGANSAWWWIRYCLY